jgi:hypothetical protein
VRRWWLIAQANRIPNCFRAGERLPFEYQEPRRGTGAGDGTVLADERGLLLSGVRRLSVKGVRHQLLPSNKTVRHHIFIELGL